MSKVISILGLCGTGKSEATALVEKQGYTRIYFGGTVVAEVKARGLEVTEANERQVREDLRNKHGMAAMAILNAPAIKALVADGKNVIVDSIYSYAEYEYLRSFLGDNLMLISLHSSKKLRYERMSKRSVRPLTPAEVDARDFAEVTTVDKARPIALAHFHYVNDGSLADLEAFISGIL